MDAVEDMVYVGAAIGVEVAEATRV